VSSETEIDALYQLPLSEFTAARNALAKALGGAEGKTVKALVKPTVVPWAVNQLYWRARPVYVQLLATGRSLREAQIGALEGRKGAADGVRRATDGHHKVLESALTRVLQLAAAVGERPPSDEVRRVLETLSLASSHPERPGRLTTAVRPAGFEALAGVTPAAVPTGRDHGEQSGIAASTTPISTPPAAPRAGAAGRRREASTSVVEAANRRAQQAREASLAAARKALGDALAEEARTKEAVDRASERYERARDARRAAEQALRRLQG